MITSRCAGIVATTLIVRHWLVCMVGGVGEGGATVGGMET